MFTHRISPDIELKPIAHWQAAELFKEIEVNRNYLRKWHPWIEHVRTKADTERFINSCQQQYANNRGFHATIWVNDQLCGCINHLNLDWTNRWASLSYWLDEKSQGRGIMTASCRAFIAHTFDCLKLNRITIECATNNARSRAIAERLGFTLEGIVRECEWLHDHFADHAVYGLLKSEFDAKVK